MKINKKTAIVCAIAIIISGVIMVLLGLFAPESTWSDIFQNISSGVFASFIVSLVVTIVGYYYERDVIIERTDKNIKRLYVNMFVLSKIIGNTLKQIHTTTNMYTLPFEKISQLSELNVTYLDKMNLGLFNPFCKKSELASTYIQLTDYQQIAYNIKNVAINLQFLTVQYDNQALKLQNNGFQPSLKDIQDLDNLKNLINVKAAKFHEYTTAQYIELEKIAKSFYTYRKDKQSWDSIKTNLLLQMEDDVSKWLKYGTLKQAMKTL